MNTLLISLLSVCLSAFAPEQEPSSAVVEGRIQNSPSPYLILMDASGQDTVAIRADGTFRFARTLDAPRACTFMIPKVQLFHQLWMENGKTTRIGLDADHVEAISVTGDTEQECTFLNTSEPVLRTFKMPGTKSFAAYTARMEQVRDSLLSVARRTVDNPLFTAYEERSLRSAIANKQTGFFRELMADGRPVDADADYNRFMDAIDLRDDALDYGTAFTVTEWKSLCLSRTPERDYRTMIRVLADLPMKPTVKDEVIFSVMRMFIASGETDGREETYRTVLAMVQAESVKQRLGAFYEQDTRMRSDAGRVADFEVMTTDDVRVKFSSVCEKPVIYIDIWSTWCAPCCREIPYVARLVEHYKDNPDIEFVSLSIDQNVKNWKAFLAKADHTGWKQYLIPAEAQRAFMNAFAINGIPRFLVIGRDGKILDSNAPRPSSEGITEYLNKQIDKAAH